MVIVPAESETEIVPAGPKLRALGFAEVEKRETLSPAGGAWKIRSSVGSAKRTLAPSKATASGWKEPKAVVGKLRTRSPFSET